MKILSTFFRLIAKYLLGVIVSGLFIWLAFRNIDLQLLVSHVRRIPVAPIALCVAGQFSLQVLHWTRWGLVLRQFGQVRWKRIFIMGAIGNAALYILPARIGELVRPTLATRENEIDFGAATATTVIERMVDGLVISAILFGSLLALRNEPTMRTLFKSGLAFFSVFVGGTLFLFLSYKYREAVMRTLQRIIGFFSPNWAKRVVDLFSNFIRGIHLASTSNVLLPYLGLSLALWLIDITSIYWLFGIIDIKLNFIAAVITISVLALGSLIPSGPARIGVFEFTIAFSLGVFSVPPEEAILIATVFHVIFIALVFVLGIVSLWLDRVTTTPMKHPSPS
jgi:uncharacterized protein (TIRG00374 family)